MIAPPASLFNTHGETIAAPVDRVWSLFNDRSRWMESFVSRTLIAGTEGRAGAIAEVRMDVPGTPLRREELVHVEPERRQVVRITAAGMAAMAHADFRFDPLPDGGCRLTVSIHTILPGAAETGDMHAATQAKISSDFARLRAVAEGRG